MKTKINPKLAFIPAILLMAICLTACDDDDDYGPMGSALTSCGWELYSVNNIPVYQSDVVEFQFYPGGGGTYGRYDYSMNWYTVPITWDMYSQGPYTYLQVWVDSTGQTWDYRITMSGGYNPTMQLVDMDNGNVLLFDSY